jgi:hypothetical protein
MSLRPFLGIAATLGFFFAGGALSAEKGVTFDVVFRGSVDCQKPEEYINAPLFVKGKATLKTDGTASANLTLTAYYVIEAKYQLAGKLGAPPADIGGGTGQLRVLNENGLALILRYPDSTYTMQITVKGPRCDAELIGKTTNSKQIYNIFALDSNFECSRFELPRSTCKIAS